MNEVLLVNGMAIVTFLIRYPVLALLGKISLPDPALRALRYIPAAVLTAIIVPEVFLPDTQLKIANNPFLLAAVVAVLVSWRTKNLLLTIVIGMTSLWLFRALLGI